MSIAIQDAAHWSQRGIGKWSLDQTKITIQASLADAEWRIADGNIQLRTMEDIAKAKQWAEIYAREWGLL